MLSFFSCVIVALGANLPAPEGTGPLETCRRAAAALDGLPGLRVVARSGWFVSAPVPRSDQPDYVNGAVTLAGRTAPAALLERLLALEAAHGRTRSVANAARPLDLDIVGMDGLVRAAPDPVLPHPRAHSRPFVLAPVAEAAPGWRHPLLGETASVLLARLGPAAARGLVRLPDPA